MQLPSQAGVVASVSFSDSHDFSKVCTDHIRVIAGEGVEGDAHCGANVRHRSRVAVDPNQPNLRQVHLMHSELFDDLRNQGFNVAAGDLGENITTSGIDLLSLPLGTLLKIGTDVELEVTGLRNPCAQIERFQPGLLAAVLGRTIDGTLIRKAGIMTVALVGGTVRVGDPIQAILPPEPHSQLEVV